MLSHRDVLRIFIALLALCQFGLYLPELALPKARSAGLDMDQFSFSIETKSPIAKELIGSITEFLKLISFLTIDMGWKSDLTDPALYNEENLVNTLQSDNIYKMNHFGHCKYRNGIQEYCTKHTTMDISAILIEDVGMQLGRMSTAYVDNVDAVGRSFVYTYYLLIKYLHDLLPINKEDDNEFLKIVVGETSSKHGLELSNSKFKRAIDSAYTLMKVNKARVYWHLIEISLAAVVTATTIFEVISKTKTAVCILQLNMGSLILCMTIADITMMLLYIIMLKGWHSPQMDDSKESSLLQVKVGSAFHLSCIRAAIQTMLVGVSLYYYLSLAKVRNEKEDEEIAL